MRRFFPFLALAFLLSSAALMRAANMDISDPTCIDCINPVGTSFTFNSNGAGGGFLEFTNNSGVDWTSLNIIETGVPAFIGDVQNIFLSSNAFTNFQAIDQADGSTLIRFFGVSTDCSLAIDVVLPCGILSGQLFTINLNDAGTSPTGSGGWLDANGNSISFAAVANPVPEPASLLLLGSGIVGVFGRKFRKRR